MEECLLFQLDATKFTGNNNVFLCLDSLGLGWRERSKAFGPTSTQTIVFPWIWRRTSFTERGKGTCWVTTCLYARNMGRLALLLSTGWLEKPHSAKTKLLSTPRSKKVPNLVKNQVLSRVELLTKLTRQHDDLICKVSNSYTLNHGAVWCSWTDLPSKSLSSRPLLCTRAATEANIMETVTLVPLAEFHMSKFTSLRVRTMFWGQRCIK